jgi:hypothetical protein
MFRFGAAGMGMGAARAGSSLPTEGDPFFSNVVLLVSFDGADGATSAVDESPSGHTLTFGGNAQIDTAQAKFGGASLLLDGTGDYVQAADHADWTMTGQFTIECFFRYAAASSSFYTLISQWGAAAARAWWFGVQPAASLQLAEINISTDASNITHDVQVNDANYAPATWIHLAADRDASNTIRLYVDGVMVASKTAASGMSAVATAMRIGLQANDANGAACWIDEVRITKGAARYASDGGFAPPVAAFPRSA